jgi:hypothetical protein
MKQNVVGFDITMHNISPRKHLEGFYHLPKEEKCPLFWEGAFFLHELIHGASVAVLVDEVKVIGSLEHIDVFDDVRAVLECGQDVDFVDCAFLKLRDFLELLSLNYLDGDLLFCLEVHSFVNFSINPFS